MTSARRLTEAAIGVLDELVIARKFLRSQRGMLAMYLHGGKRSNRVPTGAHLNACGTVLTLAKEHAHLMRIVGDLDGINALRPSMLALVSAMQLARKAREIMIADGVCSECGARLDADTDHCPSECYACGEHPPTDGERGCNCANPGGYG